MSNDSTLKGFVNLNMRHANHCKAFTQFLFAFFKQSHLCVHSLRTVNILREVLMIAELSGGSLQHILFKNTIIAQGLR